MQNKKTDLKLYGSKNKDAYGRKLATEYRGKVYNICYCFPSTQARDIHQAFENGILNQDTKIIPVEKDTSRRKAVIKQLLKRTTNFAGIVKSKAHKVKLNKILAKGEQIDYMPFDICGNYTAELAGWFFKNQKYFSNNMRLAMTLQVDNARQSQVLDSIDIATEGQYINMAEKILHKMKTSSQFCERVFLSPEMIKSIASQIYLLVISMPSKDIKIIKVSVYRNSDKSSQAKYMMLIDAQINNRKARNPKYLGSLRKVISVYNQQVQGNVVLQTTPKSKKIKQEKTITITNGYQLARNLGGIFGKVTSLSQLKPQKRAHIKIQAKRYGLDGEVVFQKIENRLNKYGLEAK